MEIIKHKVKQTREAWKNKKFVKPCSRNLSIHLHLCFSICVVHCSYPSLSISPPTFSLFYTVFHTNCQFALLWKEQFSSPCPILLVFLRKYDVKRADYQMALQAASLSPKLSIFLTHSLHHSCLIFLFFFFLGITLTQPLLFYHLISSGDKDW